MDENGTFDRDGTESGPMFEGRAAVGYDHGYDGEMFYFGLVLDEKYVEGFVEGAWRGSTRMIRRAKTCCGASGRRERKTWCWRSSRPNARFG